jgi:hypothetical protein
MSLLVHHGCFKRFIVAVTLVAFVPMAIAAHACKAVCMVMSGNTHLAAAELVHAGASVHSEHEVPLLNTADHLRHGGVCQLGNIPGLPFDETAPVMAAYVGSWLPPAAQHFHSFISPPPEYPPRGRSTPSSFPAAIRREHVSLLRGMPAPPIQGVASWLIK